VLAYAVIAAAVIAWRGVPAGSVPVGAMHSFLVALPLLAPAARRAGAVGQLLGDWYPLVILPALYTEIGVVNVAHGRAWDVTVQGWEAFLFGGQPSYDWIRSAPSPALSWLMHAGYLAYYGILVGTPLALVLAGRREGMRRALADVVAAFLVCYVVFLLFPVAGPRYAFPSADNAAARVPLATLTAALLDALAAWGTAFPSSHVAATVTAAGAALREWRALGVTLLVPTALLLSATVYGQFHYAVDTLGGLAVAAAVLAGAAALRHRGGRPERTGGPSRPPT
jgi:membrane-associated phospholipid phosphatase